VHHDYALNLSGLVTEAKEGTRRRGISTTCSLTLPSIIHESISWAPPLIRAHQSAQSCCKVVSTPAEMPAITLSPAQPLQATAPPNPLPGLLQTPSGLAIVELQGTVNSSLSASQRDSDGSIPVGRLHFPMYDANAPKEATAWMKRVYLYVGKHQRLTGEVRKLSKPVAVIRRREGGEAGEVEELEVAEIVYHKILFAHRPEPVGGGAA
jgi:chromosome transmission fidelity protein 8